MTFQEQALPDFLKCQAKLQEEAAHGKIQELIAKKARYIAEHKDEILTAFFAKYGFEPERAVMIEQKRKDGSWVWYVRRKTDEEMSGQPIQ